MPVFRLQDNLPEIYTDDSRDFQLLCRLYDCVNNGVIGDISSMSSITFTKECRSEILELLGGKLGFFTEEDFDDDTLRYILMAFPEIIKNKGSKKGIEEVLNIFSKINHLKTKLNYSLSGYTHDHIDKTSYILTHSDADYKFLTINLIQDADFPAGYYYTKDEKTSFTSYTAKGVFASVYTSIGGTPIHDNVELKSTTDTPTTYSASELWFYDDEDYKKIYVSFRIVDGNGISRVSNLRAIPNNGNKEQTISFSMSWDNETIESSGGDTYEVQGAPSAVYVEDELQTLNTDYTYDEEYWTIEFKDGHIPAAVDTIRIVYRLFTVVTVSEGRVTGSYTVKNPTDTYNVSSEPASVYVDDELQTLGTDYTYSEAKSTITFTDGHIPGRGSEIKVVYKWYWSSNNSVGSITLQATGQETEEKSYGAVFNITDDIKTNHQTTVVYSGGCDYVLQMTASATVSRSSYSANSSQSKWDSNKKCELRFCGVRVTTGPTQPVTIDEKLSIDGRDDADGGTTVNGFLQYENYVLLNYGQEHEVSSKFGAVSYSTKIKATNPISYVNHRTTYHVYGISIDSTKYKVTDDIDGIMDGYKYVCDAIVEPKDADTWANRLGIEENLTDTADTGLVGDHAREYYVKFNERRFYVEHINDNHTVLYVCDEDGLDSKGKDTYLDIAFRTYYMNGSSRASTLHDYICVAKYGTQLKKYGSDSVDTMIPAKSNSRTSETPSSLEKYSSKKSEYKWYSDYFYRPYEGSAKLPSVGNYSSSTINVYVWGYITILNLLVNRSPKLPTTGMFGIRFSDNSESYRTNICFFAREGYDGYWGTPEYEDLNVRYVYPCFAVQAKLADGKSSVGYVPLGYKFTIILQEGYSYFVPTGFARYAFPYPTYSRYMPMYATNDDKKYKKYRFYSYCGDNLGAICGSVHRQMSVVGDVNLFAASPYTSSESDSTLYRNDGVYLIYNRDGVYSTSGGTSNGCREKLVLYHNESSN